MATASIPANRAGADKGDRDAVASSVPPHRFSIDQFHRMIETGILQEDERAELLEGVIVAMSPTGNRHRAVVTIASEVLGAALPAGWHVIVQQPVTLRTSEPYPDLGVVRGRSRDYLDRSIGPADVGLLVEVADSSLAGDRGVKAPIYAAAQIPHLWIVNLVENCIEVYADPDPGDGQRLAAYRMQRRVLPGETLPLVLDGTPIAEIRADDLLP